MQVSNLGIQVQPLTDARNFVSISGLRGYPAKPGFDLSTH